MKIERKIYKNLLFALQKLRYVLDDENRWNLYGNNNILHEQLKTHLIWIVAFWIVIIFKMPDILLNYTIDGGLILTTSLFPTILRYMLRRPSFPSSSWLELVGSSTGLQISLGVRLKMETKVSETCTAKGMEIMKLWALNYHYFV